MNTLPCCCSAVATGAVPLAGPTKPAEAPAVGPAVPAEAVTAAVQFSVEDTWTGRNVPSVSNGASTIAVETVLLDTGAVPFDVTLAASQTVVVAVMLYGADILPIVAIMVGMMSPALAHAVMSGKAVEKSCASTAMSPRGGGRRGRLIPRPSSRVRDILAEMSVRGPRFTTASTSVVEFLNGAPSPHSAPASVDNLASKRGRFTETTTSAFSWSLNSKPMGMVGLNARPSWMSTSVTSTVKGSGLMVVPGKMSALLEVMELRLRRMVESGSFDAVSTIFNESG